MERVVENGWTKRVAFGLGCALVWLVGCAGGDRVVRSTSHFPPGRGFVRAELAVEGVDPRPMWLFIPKDYDPAVPTPAIVFLHGLFEAGHDSRRALSAGLGPVIARDPESWPFIVLFPQSTGTWRGPHRERQVLDALDWAEQTYTIDRDRVILAGLSYGGLGAWQIGARHSERLAAVVSVSGRHDSTAAPRLARVPVWAFHCSGDPFVPAASSRQMCEQISGHGGSARLTLFPAIDHDCWDRAVDESELVSWMLSQRRNLSTAAAE